MKVYSEGLLDGRCFVTSTASSRTSSFMSPGSEIMWEIQICSSSEEIMWEIQICSSSEEIMWEIQICSSSEARLRGDPSGSTMRAVVRGGSTPMRGSTHSGALLPCPGLPCPDLACPDLPCPDNDVPCVESDSKASTSAVARRGGRLHATGSAMHRVGFESEPMAFHVYCIEGTDSVGPAIPQ